MQRYFLKYEISILLASIITCFWNGSYSALFHWILLIIKYQQEGFRPITIMIIGFSFKIMIVFIVSQIMLFLPTLYPKILSIFIQLFLQYYFPLYTLPKNSYISQHNIGYQHLILPNSKHSNLTIYYPTEEQPTRSPKLFPQSDYSFRNAELAIALNEKYYKSVIPLCLTDVTEYAQIRRDDKYNVVLYSHGYGQVMNNSSYIWKALASKGYIIIGIDHQDKIIPEKFKQLINTKGFQNYRENEILTQRVPDIQMLVDFVLKDENSVSLASTLGIPFSKIDKSNISLLGYSYGGATSIQCLLTPTLSPSLTGPCILLDPWMWPLPQSSVNGLVKQKCLMIKSQTFAKWREGERIQEKMEEFMKGCQEGGSMWMERSDHAHFSDLPFYFSRELQISNHLHFIDNIEPILLQIIELIELCLRNGQTQSIKEIICSYKEKHKEDKDKLIIETI